MSEITIKTDHKYRLILDWNQLTKKEQERFDYLSDDDKIGRDFIRYRKYVYDIGEFMIAGGFLSFWDGYASDSYSSGIVCKYDPYDSDRVMMGRYYS